MDIDKIEYFFASAELCNFTKAAQKCQITQAAMSKYINSLESELNCRLFYRNNKGCELTKQGAYFYDEMQRIAYLYEQVKIGIHERTEPLIRAGIEGEHHAIPEFQMFQTVNPEVVFDIHFADRETLLQALELERLDVLLLIRNQPDVNELGNPFKVIDLPGEKECLIFSNNALQKYGTVEEVIKNLPMITKSDDRKYHDYCREGLKRKFGVEPEEIKVIDSVTNQQLVISLSKGFAIVSGFEITEDSVFHIVQMDEVFMTGLQMVYNKKNVTVETRKLITYIKEAFAK